MFLGPTRAKTQRPLLPANEGCIDIWQQEWGKVFPLWQTRNINLCNPQPLLSHRTVCINCVLGSTHKVLKKAVSSLGQKWKKFCFRFTVCLKQRGLDHQGGSSDSLNYLPLMLQSEIGNFLLSKKRNKKPQKNPTKNSSRFWKIITNIYP